MIKENEVFLSADLMRRENIVKNFQQPLCLSSKTTFHSEKLPIELGLQATNPSETNSMFLIFPSITVQYIALFLTQDYEN